MDIDNEAYKLKTMKIGAENKFKLNIDIANVQGFDLLLQKGYDPRNIDKYVDILADGFVVGKLITTALAMFMDKYKDKEITSEFLDEIQEELDKDNRVLN